MKFTCLGLLALFCAIGGVFAAEKKAPDKAKAGETSAEESAAGGTPEFNNTWAVNGPYALAGLKGKIVVLYFYESG